MAYQPKSYRKFLAASMTAAMVATALAPNVLAAEAADAKEVSFSDFNENHRAATEVYALVDKGVINGFPDGTFRPDANLTRAQAALMLARALGYIDSEGNLLVEAGAPTFTDIKEGDRAYTALAALQANDKINGFPDGTYRPDANVTRGAMAIMLANAYNLEAKTDSNPFPDLGAASASAVQALFDNGITQGKADGTFGTNDDIKRSDFAVFVYRAMQVEVVEPEPEVEISFTAVQTGEKWEAFALALADFKVEGTVADPEGVVSEVKLFFGNSTVAEKTTFDGEKFSFEGETRYFTEVTAKAYCAEGNLVAEETVTITPYELGLEVTAASKNTVVDGMIYNYDLEVVLSGGQATKVTNVVATFENGREVALTAKENNTYLLNPDFTLYTSGEETITITVLSGDEEVATEDVTVGY